MSLLNRLRPKWQNSDPDVRAEAVRQLGKDEVELLTAVAQGDTDPRVRRIAVKKLDSPRLLLEIAESAGLVKKGQPDALFGGLLEQAYRAAVTLTFGGGVNEVQRDIIAIAGLGLPRARR